MSTYLEVVQQIEKSLTSGKSLGDLMQDLQVEYQEWTKTLPHNDPISYTDWLETVIIGLRMDVHHYVMTTAEVEKLYGLAPGTVRQAIRRGLPAEKQGHDWLVARSVASQRWGDRLNKPNTSPE